MKIITQTFIVESTMNHNDNRRLKSSRHLDLNRCEAWVKKQNTFVVFHDYLLSSTSDFSLSEQNTFLIELGLNFN